MNYQVVYKEHDDNYGNWYVLNERGEYAAAPVGVQGAKKRRWLTAKLATAYMDQHASDDAHLVWLSEPVVCQAKPGATSMRHVGMHTSMATAYKPAHGGYPTPAPFGTVTGRMKSSIGHINEVPPVGTVHTGGNEEAGTIPDVVLFVAVVDAASVAHFPSLAGLLTARTLFPKL